MEREPRTETTTVTQTATAPEPGPTARHLDFFRTPSGNIGCVLIGAARCDIRERDWLPPPTPPSCDFDFGHGLIVGESGPAEFVCAGDAAIDPTAPVLDYGEDAEAEGFRCSSRTEGVTCENESTGEGFFISRQGYEIF